MSDGSRHSMYAVPEVVAGTVPNDPALALVRITGTTLGLAKDSIQSNEIRSDRQISDFRQGANQVGGDINFELSYGSFDSILQAVLASDDWASPATTGTTTIDATATGFARAAGSFVTDGFQVGQTVTSSGFIGSGLNGKSVVTAVSALALSTTPLGTGVHGVEAGDGDEQVIAAESISAGTTRTTFSFVRHFADLLTADNPYYVYQGVEIDTMQLAITANAMITGTFSVFGRSQLTAQDLTAYGAPTFPPASATSPVDSFTGTLEEGGTVIGVVTDMSLNLQNGVSSRFVVGSKDSIDPSIGRSNLTGQLVVFFENSTMVNKFIEETESSLRFTLPDGAGNSMNFYVPSLTYTGGQPDVNDEGPITLSMPFQATKDSTLGTNIIIERVPA